MLKKTAIVSLFTFISASYMAQNTTLPVYLDESKPVEQRVQDALSE
jgi:beta-glucosidase